MHIYLVNQEGTDLYKIGVTKNIPQRLKALQTANGDLLILVKEFETKFSFRLEAALHRKYKEKQTLGEWFNLNLKDVCDFMIECRKLEENFQVLKDSNTYLQEHSKMW